MEAIPGPEWEDLVDTLCQEPATVFLLGATDRGKSTLTRYLATGLARSGLRVAVVDADVGQSALCLPGTVGMRLFRSPDEVADYRCQTFAFLGSPSPVKIIPRLLEATGRFTDLARTGADVVLIDTTGLVEGELGRGLKLAEIRRTVPDQVVALQRAGECEPILARLDEVVIHRLHPHPLAKVRSQDFRSRSRAERLAAYFAGASEERFLEAEEVAVFRFSQQVSLRHAPPAAGTVIGLNRAEETLGLGVVTEADAEGITFRSPVRSLSGVRRVIFGDILL